MLIRFFTLLTSLLLGMAHAFVAAQTGSFSKLDRQIDSIRKVNTIPGLQVLVFTKDSLLYQRNLGVSNLKTNAPVTAQTLFPVASITKSFIAASALMLVQRGRLSLDEEVKKVAPDIVFTNQWEATQPVRLPHLLEHSVRSKWLARSAWLKHRGRHLSAMPVRVGLLVYALAYLGLVLLLNEAGDSLGIVSPLSITIFTLSLLGPLAALVALLGLLNQYQRISGRADRIFLLVAVVSALVVVGHMAVWGLVGLQTWA